MSPSLKLSANRFRTCKVDEINILFDENLYILEMSYAEETLCTCENNTPCRAWDFFFVCILTV